MPRKDVRWPFLPLFLLLQALTIVTVAISLPDSVSLLNSTIHSISPAPFNNTALNDSTLPRTSLNTIDYYIIGTALLLRITETGRPFSEAAVNEIMDAAIHEVVRKINAGAGKDKILHDSFAEITPAIELRIKALEDARLTYFLLGDVLAGVWQFMNQPWSGFQEIVFDILLNNGGGWGYIGYGHLTTFLDDLAPLSPETSSLS